MNAVSTARLLPFVLLAVAATYAYESGLSAEKPSRPHRLVERTRAAAYVTSTAEHTPPAWYW